MTEWNRLPKCPHCGNEDVDWWDGTTMQSDGDSETKTCGACEKDYKVTISVDYSFATEKMGVTP